MQLKIRLVNKMIKKAILTSICVIIFSLTIQNNIYATDFNPDAYKPQSTTTVSGADKVQTVANNIIGPIKIIGSVVSVLALIVMGIKYVTGSVEERAEYKKTMTPYIIGVIMVFAITNLLDIIVKIVGGL